ncbi:hypothetical protein TrLO_g4545 [Triparma laevis f. longispina]|uniref:Uncharacterized protein n=1 Tax=Triparma laevis f. longispina TaxID=1714387 RepID=A0A9W7DLW7_9STRA|nr:hypothetical protein TrLO_g4545 [Triparma laevis f. longispina]
MTIPDSLQTLDEDVFRDCSSLFPSNIDVSYDIEGDEVDTTSDVVAYLRTQQRIASLEKMVAALTTENATQATENAAQATEIAALGARIAQLEIALPTPPPNSFTSTIDFKRHFAGFVHIEMLLVLREVCKEWNDVVIERVDECVESGAMIVHGGKGVSDDVADTREFERQELVTQLIFLRNIVQIGENACNMTANLVVVEIPEGVEEIGRAAFWRCRSLTTVSFPTTLKLIDGVGFADCLSLEIVDLLHTNLQELGEYAFYECSKLNL